MGGSACLGGHYMCWPPAGPAPAPDVQADLGHLQESGASGRTPWGPPDRTWQRQPLSIISKQSPLATPSGLSTWLCPGNVLRPLVRGGGVVGTGSLRFIPGISGIFLMSRRCPQGGDPAYSASGAHACVCGSARVSMWVRMSDGPVPDLPGGRRVAGGPACEEGAGSAEARKESSGGEEPGESSSHSGSPALGAGVGGATARGARGRAAERRCGAGSPQPRPAAGTRCRGLPGPVPPPSLSLPPSQPPGTRAQVPWPPGLSAEEPPARGRVAAKVVARG